jgi:hypothetical protein
MTSINARGLLCPLIARHSTVHDGTSVVNNQPTQLGGLELSWLWVEWGPVALIAYRHKACNSVVKGLGTGLGLVLS